MPAKEYSGFGGTDVTSADHAEVATPSDTVDLTYITRAVYVGGAGTMTVVMVSGAVVSHTVVAGAILPIGITRVNATGTTATLIVGWS